MPELTQTIPITSANGFNTEIRIYPESNKAQSLIFIDPSEALKNGEAPVQLLEGCSYEYVLCDKSCMLEEIRGLVRASRANQSAGRITPGIFVGTLTIKVLDIHTRVPKGSLSLEVRSVKSSYREDYRYMLEQITEWCTELLMQQSSPVTQTFTSDFERDAQTLYQRFAFVSSLLDSSEFQEAVHRILTSPVTYWSRTRKEADIRSVRRISNSLMRQLSSRPARIELPHSCQLKERMDSVPSRVSLSKKQETADTPENRLVKHALTVFFNFCASIRHKMNVGSREYCEALQLEEKLENLLNHSLFKEISPPSTLPLNSPVLQRKEGYREVLRAWLMFDLASKLFWHGGDDVYSAGKRDVATLYEYWLFFKLLELFKDIFSIEAKSVEQLIEHTADGLGLKLKSGRYIPLQGVYNAETRKLNVQFSFNRTFSGEQQYPKGGSWMRRMRPDYTLSIWPYGFEVQEAEKQELIVHIHFDAKYKVADVLEVFGQEEDDLSEEKVEQKHGIYKRADLLKMHAYKDAIRRTAGAYVLYPGGKSLRKSGFHELIPGLGAFPINPSTNDSGIMELKAFILDIIQHFLNRASQRDRMSYHTYDIHKGQSCQELREALPEYDGNTRAAPPEDLSVLVGYCKNASHFDWIIKEGSYNVRIDNVRGSIRLSPEAAGADYLLLHTKGKLRAGVLFKIQEKGPKIFSRNELIKRGYKNPSTDYYLVYQVAPVSDKEFVGMQWDVSKLEGFKTGRASASPFVISMTELMKVKMHNNT